MKWSIKRSLQYGGAIFGAAALFSNVCSFDAQKTHLTGKDLMGNQPGLGGYGLSSYMDTEPVSFISTEEARNTRKFLTHNTVVAISQPGKQLANLIFDDWRDSLSAEDVREKYFSGISE
jgi:hypothetical protein